jgi:proline iminopeptidase
MYPEIEPFDAGRLRVSALHDLYYEQAGNPEGRPVIFLHGGPGGGIVPVYRRFFDPDAYRIVLLDQRGCGKSTPKDELHDNTTGHIVEDMEALRTHLGIDRWQVFGGSWGSTLALAYAQRYPGRVLEIVLRGATPWRQVDMEWEFGQAAAVWPEVWHKVTEWLGESEFQPVLDAFWERLDSDDETVRTEAALLWGEWEVVKCSLVPEWDPESEWAGSYVDGLARIECHYTRNGAFLDHDGQLLDEMDRIADIPGVIVQGRYDMCTNMDGAWQIARRWPAGELRIVPDGGHLLTDPGIVHELIEATDRFKQLPPHAGADTGPG